MVESRKKGRKNKPIPILDFGPSDWLVLMLRLPTSTSEFTLDYKLRSRRRNRKKWKRCDPSNPIQSGIWLRL